MARPLKVFTLGIYGFIDQTIGEALNLPRHIRQARVLVAAPTKAEAARVLGERGFRDVGIRQPEFRLAMGNDLDAYQAAGLLNEPVVLVAPSNTRSGDPVVAMQPGGEPRMIGHLDGHGFDGSQRFIPAGQP